MYTPDGITERRRKEGVSYTAFEIFLIYCEHADQDTGVCFPSSQLIAQRLGIRLDHVKSYEKELLTKLWVTETTENGQPAKKLHAGWLTRKQRNGSKKAPAESHQTLGNSPNVGKPSPQTLVNAPQDLGKSPQTLVSPYKAEPAPRTSPTNQPKKDRGGADAPPHDPRSQHAAIQAVKAMMQRWPEKVLWDDLIETLGERPDMVKLSACRKAWLGAGYNRNSLAWALEWYATGIPAKNGTGQRRGPPQSNVEKSMEAVRNYIAEEQAKCQPKRT